ncbi:MAG: ribosome-associated translation inhibitor RaiA [bacterium]
MAKHKVFKIHDKLHVTITSKQTELTPKLRDYIQQKTSKLTKYFSHISDIHIIISEEKYGHVIEVNALTNGITMPGKAKHTDVHTAFDKALAKVKNQIRRYKDKIVTHTSKQEKTGSVS